MPFNPFQEKGMPLDRQLRNWSELDVRPYDKHQTDPYTKCRVVVMNAIEVEAQLFSHQFTRNTADIDVRRQLAEMRRIEQQQQKAVNWLIPGSENVLENTITCEQAAIDLSAWVAQNEPDPYARQCYEFGVVEHFDHLYRYANLLDMLEGKRAEFLVGGYTEILPGRPTIFEHRHPWDEIRRPLARTQANPLSLLYALTLTAVEQQTMTDYINSGNRFIEPIARAAYMEIAMIAEQHVSLYESLLDPTASWSENLLLHEYNEVYLYYSCMEQEEHPRIKRLWDLHLAMELEHLRLAADLVRNLDGKDPETLVPQVLPQPVAFRENRQYLRQILTRQVNLGADRGEFVEVSQLPEDHSYFDHQSRVNSGGYIPSEQVVIQRTAMKGSDYRFAPEGPLELKTDYVEEVKEKAGLEEVA